MIAVLELYRFFSRTSFSSRNSGKTMDFIVLKKDPKAFLLTRRMQFWQHGRQICRLTLRSFELKVQTSYVFRFFQKANSTEMFRRSQRKWFCQTCQNFICSDSEKKLLLEVRTFYIFVKFLKKIPNYSSGLFEWSFDKPTEFFRLEVRNFMKM